MKCRACLLGLALVALLTARSWADPLPLSVAQGEIDKLGKDSLTVRPRDKEGRFEKSITLKLTGTSKVYTLVPLTKAGKTVLTQRETDPKDLQAKQPIAFVYTTLPEGAVLLSAVVHPAEKK
jgi:hypothetical protein